jgi:putative Holliday junction resolvase
MKHLAIDLGEKNIGTALSDNKGIIAKPHSIIRRKTDEKTFRKLLEICKQKSVEKIIVGIPLTAKKERQQQYRSFAAKLQRKTNLPLEFWDETFSTKRAQNMIAFLDDAKKRRKTQTHRDDVAAAIILQEYLDHEKTA